MDEQLVGGLGHVVVIERTIRVVCSPAVPHLLGREHGEGPGEALDVVGEHLETACHQPSRAAAGQRRGAPAFQLNNLPRRAPPNHLGAATWCLRQLMARRPVQPDEFMISVWCYASPPRSARRYASTSSR